MHLANTRPHFCTEVTGSVGTTHNIHVQYAMSVLLQNNYCLVQYVVTASMSCPVPFVNIDVVRGSNKQT